MTDLPRNPGVPDGSPPDAEPTAAPDRRVFRAWQLAGWYHRVAGRPRRPVSYMFGGLGQSPECEMFIRCSIATPACFILLVGGPPAGQPDKPVVSLLLSKASAERSDRDVLFRCEAALDNVGKELTVRSSFFSAFDGLELVVTAPDGKVLAQQHYTLHQSPHGPARAFALKPGRTERRLVFPIPATDLPGDVKSVKVRLVGTLPGSDYQRILSSDTLGIDVK